MTQRLVNVFIETKNVHFVYCCSCLLAVKVIWQNQICLREAHGTFWFQKGKLCLWYDFIVVIFYVFTDLYKIAVSCISTFIQKCPNTKDNTLCWLWF